VKAARIAWLVSLSCSGSTMPVQRNAVPAPRAPLAIPCPQGEALTPIARAAFGAPTTASVASVTCTALHNRAGARWIVDGYIEHASELERHVGVVAASDGRVLSTADLDGDGDDELLVWQEELGDNSLHGELHVRVLQRDRLVDIARLPIADTRGGVPDVPEPFAQCRAQHRVIEGPHATKRIELMGEGDLTGADCPEPGRHVYGFANQAFSEVER